MGQDDYDQLVAVIEHKVWPEVITSQPFEAR